MRAYTLTVSGSTILSGSLNSMSSMTATEFIGGGSGLTGVTAEWDGTHTGNGVITGDFTVDTNTLFVDASENTVGIGTSSPGSPLHIKGSALGVQALIQSTGTNSYPNLTLQNDAIAWGMYADGDDKYKIYSDVGSPVARFTIDTAGKVGIGTTSPAQILDIQQSGNNPQIQFSYGNDPTNYHNNIRADVGSAKTYFEITSAGTTTTPLTITATSVGIGTTSPGSPLHIKGSTPDLIVEDSSGGSNSGILKFKKLVTSSAADDDAVGEIDFRAYNDANEETLFAYITGWARDVSNGTEDGEISFYTMGSGSIPARMTITSDKVGIGTMSPGKTLDIVGTFRVSSDTFLQSHTYLPDNKHLYLGTGADSSIVQTGSVMKINNTAGNMELQIDGTTALTLADTTGNATFAGNVYLNSGSNLILRKDTTDTDMWQLDNSSGTFRIFQSGFEAFTMADDTGNATFAGTLETTGTLTTTTIESFNGSHVQVKRNDGSNAILKIANTHTGNAMIQFDASNGDFTGNDDAYIGHLNSSHNLEIATNASSGNIVLKSKNTTALTLNGANATFAGTIDSGAITSTGQVRGTKVSISGNAYFDESVDDNFNVFGASGVKFNTWASSQWNNVLTLDTSKNATFAGNITVSGTSANAFSGDLDVAGAKYLYLGAYTRINNPGSGAFKLGQYNGSSWLDTLDITNAGDATFAGKVTINETVAEILQLNTTHADGGFMTLKNSGATYGYIGSSEQLVSSSHDINDLTIRSENELYLVAGGSGEDVKIDTDGSATFAGNMTIGSRTGFTVHGSGADLFIGSSSGDNGMTIGTATGSNAYIFFADTDQNNRGYIAYQQANDLFRIGTAGTQRFEINATGATFAGDVTVTGGLTINGTTTTVSTTNMLVEDNLIELNNGAGSNANDSGIVIERGSTGDNAIFAWDESADRFITGTTTATGASTGDLTITAAPLQTAALTATTGTFSGLINGLYINAGGIGDADSGGNQRIGGEGRTHLGGYIRSYGGNAGGKLEIYSGTSGAGTLALTINSSQNATFAGNVNLATDKTLTAGTVQLLKGNYEGAIGWGNYTYQHWSMAGSGTSSYVVLKSWVNSAFQENVRFNNDGTTLFNWGVSINDGGNAAGHFRVESDTNTDLISTNADNIGRIGFGAAVSGNALYYFAGTMSHRWTGADGRGTWFNTSHTPNDARSGEIVRISGAITEISSGTHPWFRGLGLFAPTITTAGGSVTNSATLYIDGAMSNATNNYSVYVAGGNSYFAGSITSGTHISVGTSIDMPNGGSINCGDSGSGELLIYGGGTYKGGYINLRGGGNSGDIRMYTSGASATSILALTIDSSQQATFAGVVSFPDGSASAPSITNTGDTDTGFYFGAANEINMTLGGTQIWRWSGQQLGAQLGANPGYPAYSFGTDWNSGMYLEGADILAFSTGGVKRFDLNASGNATFAGQVKASNFLVSGTQVNWGADGGTSNRFRIQGGSGSHTELSVMDSHNMAFKTEDTLVLTLDTSQNATFTGEVYVGGATGLGTSKLQVLGTTTSSLGDPQMVVYGGTAVNSIASIGLGHIETLYQESPAEIGFKTTNAGGGTFGDLIFATRAGTTGAPTTRLTIASNGNATFTGAITIASGGGNMIIQGGQNMYFDGGSHTRITESSNDVLDFYAGTSNTLKLSGVNAVFAGAVTVGTNLIVAATNKFYLDGGSDTYLYEYAGDQALMVAGNQKAMWWRDNNTSIPKLAKLYLDATATGTKMWYPFL